MPRILLHSVPLIALVAGIPGIALAAIGGPSPQADPSGKPKTSGPVPEIPGLTGQETVQAVKWDYFENPVSSSSPSSRPEGFVFGTIPLFDGYPERVSQPSIRIYWNAEAPQPGKPVQVEMEYPQPLAVTRFVHYFDRVPRAAATNGGKEVYWQGWREVEVQASVNGRDWSTLETTVLERDFPQVIGIRKPVTASHYRVVVKSMLEPADKLHSYELETWYGATMANVSPGTPPVQSEPLSLNVRIHSLDGKLEGGTLHLTAPDGWVRLEEEETAVPVIDRSSADVAVKITPVVSGVIPLTLTLNVGGRGN